MLKHTLSAVLAAALWTTFLPVQAQTTPAQPSAPPNGTQATPGAPPTGNPPTQGTPPAPKPAMGTDVVGSVFGKQITWNELIARMRKESPAQFNNVVATVVGPKVASDLFGDPAKPSVTLTQEDVYAAIRQTPPPVVSTVLENMLMQDAFSQEAAKQGVTVTDAQVNARINKVLQGLRQQGRIPPNVTDDQFLAQQHITREQLINNFKPQMLALALIDKEQAQKYGHPVGPEDFVQARHILIKAPVISPTSTAADKKADADAKAKIEKIRADITSGKIKFEDAAKKYSDDPSKGQGGDLGPFMRGTMVPEFDATVFKLKPGEVSQPIHTQFGYHLIQVEKLGKDIPADQRDQIKEQHEGQLSRTYVMELRQKANITDNLRPAMPAGMLPGGPPPGH